MNHVNMQLLGAKGLPGQLVSSLVWNGQFGVQMFFAVSGFLITATTLRRWGSLAAVSVRGFYLLRFARIAPLLLLLLATLSVLHLAQVKHFVVSADTGGLGRALLAALTFHINLLEARKDYLPPSWDILWSLSVEEMFYLFFPLICRLLGRGQLLIGLLSAFAMLGPFARARAFNHNPVWREYSYLGGMDAIALGCLTALLLAQAKLSARTARLLGLSGAVLLVFSLGFSLRAYAWGLGRNGLNMTVLAVGTCLLIAGAAKKRWEAPKMLAPLLQMGRRSYEIYLTHVFTVLALFGIFLHFGKPIRFVPVLFIGVIVAAVLVGEIVARVYTDPMNRLLRQRWGKAGAMPGE